ncbi:MAG: hypothetical protein GPJ22_16325 [Microcystis aeruginosa LL13-03]|jgi:hypothetical protein|nr:hypothetical protein [Microcystis aeruginosa LL13-03]NCR67486.1 hypothetical protein [Microcystis aeruginosa LL11-07]
MAKIVLSDLRLAGADLFTDSESFMMDLSDEELDVVGGAIWTIALASSKGCILGAGLVAGAVWGWFAN